MTNEEIREQVFARIRAERERQVSEEGWTPEHDDEYEIGKLAMAAGCYVRNAVWRSLGGRNLPREQLSIDWPWEDKWWKPTTPDRDLEKAAALLVAEMERRARAGVNTGE